MALHPRQYQGSPGVGVGSSERAPRWTAMALVLFLFTLTCFSSLGFGAGAASESSWFPDSELEVV